MVKITFPNVVKTAIVSSFTIATALIWKDVIIKTIEHFFPPKEALIYEFIVVAIATILLILILYAILTTETKTESFFRRFFRRKKRSKKKR